VAITTILELRILPPFAIGRLGSSPEPMDNYELAVDEQDPTGYRRLRPAETLRVDPDTGELSAWTPRRLRFKDASGRVRPVAPFLEVWARFEPEGPLLPLTGQHLADLGLDPDAVQWRVQVGNIKVFRRTGDQRDQVHADTGLFGDHTSHELSGQCPNFLPGKSLPLGQVRYIRPNDAFPQIRLRFIPAAGHVYGPRPPEQPSSDNPPDWKLIAQTERMDHIIQLYGDGPWPGHIDPNLPKNPNHEDVLTARKLTVPAQIYAGYNDPPDSDTPNWVSKGFLDDECDGIVDVQLTIADPQSGQPRTLAAFARIAAGPPAFAPDSEPVRTVADELEQAMFGTEAAGPIPRAEVEQIVRRAIETVRLMNTDFLNQPYAGMGRMDNLDTNRLKSPIMDPAVMDALAIRARHEQVLLALESGGLAWFARMLREYDKVGDLSDEGRRKMPALMRNADGRHLALTRRQLSKVKNAAQAMAQTPPQQDEHED
jgi:hypothetical protein